MLESKIYVFIRIEYYSCVLIRNDDDDNDNIKLLFQYSVAGTSGVLSDTKC
jgi:hypothetical protein